VWVHKEQRQDLHVAWFGLVKQLERQYTVLEYVWKRDKAAFLGNDVADVLYSGLTLLAPEDFREPIEVALFMADVVGLRYRMLAEREMAFSNISTVVVVECSGANVLVLGVNTLAKLNAEVGGHEPAGSRRASPLPYSSASLVSDGYS
jgi:hypothetical protein